MLGVATPEGNVARPPLPPHCGKRPPWGCTGMGTEPPSVQPQGDAHVWVPTKELGWVFPSLLIFLVEILSEGLETECWEGGIQETAPCWGRGSARCDGHSLESSIPAPREVLWVRPPPLSLCILGNISVGWGRGSRSHGPTVSSLGPTVGLFAAGVA